MPLHKLLFFPWYLCWGTLYWACYALYRLSYYVQRLAKTMGDL